MFARIFALLPLVLAVSAQQCNTGGAYCCNSVQSVQQAEKTLLAHNLVEAALQLGGDVGLDCSPVTVIGTGSGCEAKQDPVCCQDNRYNGGVNLGCSPVSASA